MKWFYVMAVALAAGLTALPMFYLPYLLRQHIVAQPGQIVRYDSYGSDIKSIDPATCGDTTSSFIQANFYEGLYCYHYLKRPMTVIPQLAAEMPAVSPDGLTYTIKLKAGVKYTPNPCFGMENGKPLTRTVKAQDFVTAFQRVSDYHVNTGLAWAFVSGRIVGVDDFRAKTKTFKPNDFSRYDVPVAGIRALDDLTLQIQLTDAFPQMIYVLAMTVYAPVPREAVDHWLARRNRVEFREAEEVVSTGPYVLKVFDRNVRVTMERNPDFRDEYYPTEGAPGDAEAGLLVDAGKKVPFIDVLNYEFVREDYSGWMRFLTRQTDAAGIPKEVFESVINPGKDLDASWARRGILLHKSEGPDVFWLAFNMEDPVVGKSKSLRQAMCLCFDVDNYIKVLFNGRGRRAVNIIPSSFAGHEEAGPGPYYRLDMAQALEKVKAAKEELAAAGKLDEKGNIPKLRVDLGSTDSRAKLEGEFIKYEFHKIGLDVEIILNEWSTQQEKVNNKQCQIYAMGWQADYPDAENFLQLFYSPNIDKQTNNTNYSSPEFDALYRQIRTMPDSPPRTAIYARMADMISDDCPVLLLTEPLNFVLNYKWLSNVKPHPIGYGFAKYQRIDEKLRRQMGGP